VGDMQNGDDVGHRFMARGRSKNKLKDKKSQVKIIGYTKDLDGYILPVFSSEKGLYKGKIYKTSQEAKEGIK
jgi:hypothetical protein